MRLRALLYINGRLMREWNFIHPSEGVPVHSEFKLDLAGLSHELYGYETQQPHESIVNERLVFKIETYPEG